ncbi:hypothetical protein [Baaleninema sp.]|uniref:hypothetical protein n=1 Tax=Baaleninema sp. TaxID=3101197 RepID=UPI003CFFC5B5
MLERLGSINLYPRNPSLGGEQVFDRFDKVAVVSVSPSLVREAREILTSDRTAISECFNMGQHRPSHVIFYVVVSIAVILGCYVIANLFIAMEFIAMDSTVSSPVEIEV